MLEVQFKGYSSNIHVIIENIVTQSISGSYFVFVLEYYLYKNTQFKTYIF